ncbi:MAG: hypothetical protein LBF22_10360 [Deltaproteobacteria bacterium]|jgi:transposase|nr:hypothetical protein [Deltaproteobacteria bacterium]
MSYNSNNTTTLTEILPETDSRYSALEQLIGIIPPFYIINHQVDLLNFESHLYINYKNKLTFTSSCCGVGGCKVHSKSHRIFRTLDILNTKTFIHMDVPRIKCLKCGKIITLELPWIDKNFRLTKQFVQRVIALSEFLPFTTVSKVMGESDTRLSAIAHKSVVKARENLD